MVAAQRSIFSSRTYYKLGTFNKASITPYRPPVPAAPVPKYSLFRHIFFRGQIEISKYFPNGGHRCRKFSGLHRDRHSNYQLFFFSVPQIPSSGFLPLYGLFDIFFDHDRDQIRHKGVKFCASVVFFFSQVITDKIVLCSTASQICCVLHCDKKYVCATSKYFLALRPLRQ